MWLIISEKFSIFLNQTIFKIFTFYQPQNTNKEKGKRSQLTTYVYLYFLIFSFHLILIQIGKVSCKFSAL